METNTNDKTRQDYTLAVNIHSTMPECLFKECLISILDAYENTTAENRGNIKFLICMDTITKEEYKAKLNKEDIYALKNKQINTEEAVKQKIAKLVECKGMYEDLYNSEQQDKKKYGSTDYRKEGELIDKRITRLNNQLEELLKFGESSVINEEDENKIKEEMLKQYEINKRKIELYMKMFILEIERIDKGEKPQNSLLNNNEHEIKEEETIGNSKVEIVRSYENIGKVSDGRNIAMDLTETEYLSYLDGDDNVNSDALNKISNECKNNSQNQNREIEIVKLGLNQEISIDLEPTNNRNKSSVINLDLDLQKATWSRILNPNSLKKHNIRFINNIGSDDGPFLRELIYHSDKLNFAMAKRENRNVGTLDQYVKSDTNGPYSGKDFEEIIQILYHITKKHKNSMEMHPKTKTIFGTPDPSNIFQCFSTGGDDVNNGFSRFCYSNNSFDKIVMPGYCGENKNFGHIIFGLILYPEVLVDGKEKNYFLEVRKKLKEELKNGEKNIKVFDVLKGTNPDKYEELIKTINENIHWTEERGKDSIDIETPENYVEEIENLALKDFGNNNEKIFLQVLSNLELDAHNNIVKIKNPHVTKDSSKIAILVDFKNHFTFTQFSQRSEQDQIRMMNKLLKGKFFPNTENRSNINDINNRICLVVDNLYKINSSRENRYLFNIIQKTNAYNNNPTVKQIVDKQFHKKTSQIKLTDNLLTVPSKSSRTLNKHSNTNHFITIPSNGNSNVPSFKQKSFSKNKQKNARDMYNLGAIYFNGSGIKKDINKAKYYFKIAAKQSFSPAIKILNNLETPNCNIKSNFDINNEQSNNPSKKYTDSEQKLNETTNKQKQKRKIKKIKKRKADGKIVSILDLETNKYLYREVSNANEKFSNEIDNGFFINMSKTDNSLSSMSNNLQSVPELSKK